MRTRLSICAKKMAYRSVEDALAAAAGFDPQLRAYRCDRCRRVHLTRRTRGKRIARPPQ